MELARGYVWTQVQTTTHKFWVAYYILRFVCWDFLHDRPDQLRLRDYANLLWRAAIHDLSKYRWDEAKHFARSIFKLKTTTYGTPEYKALLDSIRPALDLHYRRNRHHPEYWAWGVNQMEPLDKIEMVMDFCAAVRRHNDGDVQRSIKQNQERFGYSDRDREYFSWLAFIVGGRTTEARPTL